MQSENRLFVICFAGKIDMEQRFPSSIAMLAGCKFIVMKVCLMNEVPTLRSVLAISHVYVVKIDILCFRIYYKEI